MSWLAWTAAAGAGVFFGIRASQASVVVNLPAETLEDAAPVDAISQESGGFAVLDDSLQFFGNVTDAAFDEFDNFFVDGPGASSGAKCGCENA